MKLLDIHSHHLSEDPFRAILNIRFPKDKFFPEAGRFYSVGVHPWEVTLENRIDWTLFEELAGHPQVLAIGGKPELALEMLRSGFYLSLGIRYNEDSLRVIPLDRLFLETDDSETDICQVYERAARTLGISVIKLTEQIQHNIKKVFFNG